MPNYLWYNSTRSIRRALSSRSGYTVVNVQGFSLPDKDHIFARAPQQHGATYVDTFFRPRELSLVIAVAGCDAEDFQAKHRELVRAMNPLDAGELRVLADDAREYTLTCRPVTAMEVSRYNSRIAEVLVQLIADDPFFYLPATTTQFTSAVTLGLTIPFTISALISSPTNEASLSLTNDGHVPAYPTITINGPVTNPEIINDTVSETLAISETINAGDVLTVDMGLRTAIITSGGGGTSNVLGSASGIFWSLRRGSTTVRITSEAGAVFNGTIVFAERYLAVV